MGIGSSCNVVVDDSNDIYIDLKMLYPKGVHISARMRYDLCKTLRYIISPDKVNPVSIMDFLDFCIEDGDILTVGEDFISCLKNRKIYGLEFLDKGFKYSWDKGNYSTMNKAGMIDSPHKKRKFKGIKEVHYNILKDFPYVVKGDILDYIRIELVDENFADLKIDIPYNVYMLLSF